VKYQGEAHFAHDSQPRLGVLLLNLGTPDAPTAAALREYLGQFLADPRVVETPRWLWWLILHGFILRIRPRRSAIAYRKVWTHEGSPLLLNAQHQTRALQAALDKRLPGPVRVGLAMRYGRPSVAQGLHALREASCRRLLVLPLYPQYSATTTASGFDAIADVLKTWRWLPEMRFINQYHDEDGYINALAASIRAAWNEHPAAQRLLFSFHGIPRRYLLSGDPYHCQCQKTARLVAERLGLPAERWAVSFQSRVGREEWLRPYTDHVLKGWGAAGVPSVDVVCPGFSADCLETLEEIGEQNRDLFLETGGQRYRYILALNDRPIHIEALAELVAKHTQGWAEASPDWDRARVQAEATATLERALAMGAER
jgi:ferrochelatase